MPASLLVPAAELTPAIAALATQGYGPLYVVCAKTPLESTPCVYLLDPGQQLEIERSALPDVPHSDLRPDQEVYGRVTGTPHWYSCTYTWKKEHPRVQDGSAPSMLEQLIDADKTAIELGMHDFWARQLWLSQWARNNLGTKPMMLPLPELDTQA